MRIVYLFALVVAINGCLGQSPAKPTVIFNKEFNWKIEIPEGFESVPPEVWRKMQNKGVDAIEKTYDAKVENDAKTIFVFRSDPFNYFESNWQPFDSAKDGDYRESCKNVNQVMYGTFEAQMPQATLDSASSEETIDGKVFQVFRTTITIPGKLVMECRMYSRLFGKKEFTVNMLTVNKEKQRLLLNAWRKSTFTAR